jgi:hypothetical protein
MIFPVRPFLKPGTTSIIFMSNFPPRSLFKMFLLLFSLHCMGQKDSGLKIGHDSNELQVDSTLPGFIKVAADPQLKGNGFKKFLVGKNYREEWFQPVKVPVLDLRTAYGGLVPKRLGGGKETKSLRIEDSTGREWALRSVEKFPENAIPPDLRKTIAEKIVKDGISASYPYGALSMGTLSKAVNVPFLKDSLVYIPNGPALGEFSSKFKNILVLMEEREPSGLENDQGKKKKRSVQKNLFMSWQMTIIIELISQLFFVPDCWIILLWTLTGMKANGIGSV